MERPSEDEVFKTAERTRLALEKLTNGKIKAAQPSRVSNQSHLPSRREVVCRADR